MEKWTLTTTWSSCQLQGRHGKGGCAKVPTSPPLHPQRTLPCQPRARRAPQMPAGEGTEGRWYLPGHRAAPCCQPLANRCNDGYGAGTAGGQVVLGSAWQRRRLRHPLSLVRGGGGGEARSCYFL